MKNGPHRHRFTADEYNWMAEIGLLNGERPVELIEGDIIQMAPMGTQHTRTVERLQRTITAALREQVLINIQRVFRLSEITETQPDLTVQRRPPKNHAQRSDEAPLLVIEVSHNTLQYDRDIKVPVYAANGVPEVWIVDLDSRCVRFFRAPVAGRYTDARTTSAPGLVTLADFPHAPIDLSGVLDQPLGATSAAAGF